MGIFLKRGRETMKMKRWRWEHRIFHWSTFECLFYELQLLWSLIGQYSMHCHQTMTSSLSLTALIWDVICHKIVCFFHTHSHSTPAGWRSCDIFLHSHSSGPSQLYKCLIVSICRVLIVAASYYWRYHFSQSRISSARKKYLLKLEGFPNAPSATQNISNI